MPFFVGQGPSEQEPTSGTQYSIMLGMVEYDAREDADAAAVAGAEARERAGYGGGRTIVIEADDYASAMEAAHLELTGKPLEMPEEARQRLRDAGDSGA